MHTYTQINMDVYIYIYITQSYIYIYIYIHVCIHMHMLCVNKCIMCICIYIDEISEVGGVSPTGKSLVSCAASGCGRRGASCRWVARRQHVLLLLLLRSFSLVFSRWILSPTPNPPYQPQAGLIGIYIYIYIYTYGAIFDFLLHCEGKCLFWPLLLFHFGL